MVTDSQHANSTERPTFGNPDLKATCMPRNTSPAVRSDSASTQAIVLKRSTKKSHNSPRKPAKTRGYYLPETKVLRIQQRYINGQNKSEIAREEKCDRETVARIVAFPEVRNFIAEMQQQFYGLVPDAMAAVRYALQATKDPRIGYQVLEATGVAPHQGERLQVPEATSSETGIERQARMVACVLLEGRKHAGVDLPTNIEDMLAKELGESTERAKTAQPRLPR
jgi:hypothetical protein